jgi:hypothetical protein
MEDLKGGGRGSRNFNAVGIDFQEQAVAAPMVDRSDGTVANHGAQRFVQPGLAAV